MAAFFYKVFKMADFSLHSTPNIIISSYSASFLGKYIEQYGKRCMFIVDPVLRSVGLLDKVTQSLQTKSLDYFIFDDFEQSPTTKTITQALNLARDSHIHSIVAFGGTKTFCVARAVSSLFFEPSDIYSYIDGKEISKPSLPLICLNSTFREPFVFTNKIPLVDSRKLDTQVLTVQENLCKTLIFDSNLCVSLTENQKQTMAFESLCLALESSLCQNANFFTQMLSEKTIELLKTVICEKNSLTITTQKEELLVQAGAMASFSVGTGSLGVASLLALTINNRFNVGHPLVSSILLPSIIEYYGKFKTDQIVHFASIFIDFGEELSKEEKIKAFADFIREQMAKDNLPSRLKELSVPLETLALAVEDATKTEYTNFLPRAITNEELFELLKAAY